MREAVAITSEIVVIVFLQSNKIRRHISNEHVKCFEWKYVEAIEHLNAQKY